MSLSYEGGPNRSAKVAMTSSTGSPNETMPSPSPRRTRADGGNVEGVAIEVVVESATVVVVAIDVAGGRVVTVDTDCGTVAVVSLVSVDTEVQPTRTTTAIAATTATRDTLLPFATTK